MSSIKLKQRTGSIKLKRRSGSIKLKERTGRIVLNPSNFDDLYFFTAILTVDSTKVGADLTDFPTYVDLAHMPQRWWDRVKPDGGDIRVFRDGNPLPREVVSIDRTAQTGELHFKYDELLASQDREIEIIVDGKKEEPAPDSPIGRYNVWMNGYLRVSHDGGLTDATINAHNGTNNGTTITNGKIGSARDFDGNSYIHIPTIDKTISEVTLSVWINLDVYGRYDGIIHSRGTDVTGINLNTDGNQLGYTWNNAANTYKWRSELQFTLGSWQYAVMCVTASQAIAYLDENSAVNAVSHDQTIIDNLNIGFDGYGEKRKINAQIDEARIASLARSDGWVSTEYANQDDPSSFYTVSEGG